ncbi:MAG TPA: hypothetical protein VFC78_12710 [Tepidisphaeraceae bacterium]|nr:hypothetical protein [Tepidisphaeraceae bacterium]
MSSQASIRFPTTQWSLVARAGDPDHAARRAALEEVLGQYDRPIRAHLQSAWGMSEAGAEDVSQGFIARQVLENELLGEAEAHKGRFRNYLLTALDRYAANVRRGERAIKRGHGRDAAFEELDAIADRGRPPGDALDVAWGRRVLERAIELMRRECELGRRPQVLRIFEVRVLGPTLQGQPPVPYDELVERLSLASPAQASNLLITAKRMFIRCLRQVVCEYETDERKIDEEIEDLRRILSGSQAGIHGGR